MTSNIIVAVMLLFVFIAFTLDMLHREKHAKKRKKLSLVEAERDMYKKRYELLSDEIVKRSKVLSSLKTNLRIKLDEVKGETQKS